MKKMYLVVAMALSCSAVLMRGVRADEATEKAPTIKMPAPVPASATPQTGKVGQTLSVTLEERQKQDFNFDLPKGQFYVFCDAQRVGDGSLTTSIDSSLQLLKRNGAAFPQYGGDFIYWNSHEKETRAGKVFSFAQPTGIRFRLKNQSDGTNNFWLTVVPAQPVKFVPYGFGATVIPAKIGPNNGTGGVLESKGFAYLRATIPAGKWSISLGAKEEEGRCFVTLLSLNERGLDYPQSFSLITAADDYGSEARTEKILTLTKPTMLLFRVYNEGAATQNPVTYDVTIEPSSD